MAKFIYTIGTSTTEDAPREIEVASAEEAKTTIENYIRLVKDLDPAEFVITQGEPDAEGTIHFDVRRKETIGDKGLV